MKGYAPEFIQCKPRLLRRAQSRWGFQRGEAAALPVGRTRGFKHRVRHDLIIRGIKLAVHLSLDQDSVRSFPGRSRACLLGSIRPDEFPLVL